MNLVDLVHQELDGGLLARLGSLTGQGETKTRMAAAAAAPVILSALAAVAETPQGAERVAVMARKFTPEEVARIGDMTTSQAGSVYAEGRAASLDLFPGGTETGLHGVIIRFTGLDRESVHKLMGYLLPIIFGTMTRQFGVTGLTASTVSALFAEQKQNICNAMPAGMSVEKIPGIGKVSTGNGGMLLALLVILAAAAAAYWYFVWRPAQMPAPVNPGPANVAPAP